MRGYSGLLGVLCRYARQTHIGAHLISLRPLPSTSPHTHPPKQMLGTSMFTYCTNGRAAFFPISEVRSVRPVIPRRIPRKSRLDLCQVAPVWRGSLHPWQWTKMYFLKAVPFDLENNSLGTWKRSEKVVRFRWSAWALSFWLANNCWKDW